MHCIQCNRLFKATKEKQLFHSGRCRNLWRLAHPRCFYCGVSSGKVRLDRDRIYGFRHRKGQSHRRMSDETIPACKSCNLILAAEEPQTILERFDFLATRMALRGGHIRGKDADRYKQLLKRRKALHRHMNPITT